MSHRIPALNQYCIFFSIKQKIFSLRYINLLVAEPPGERYERSACRLALDCALSTHCQRS